MEHPISTTLLSRSSPHNADCTSVLCSSQQAHQLRLCCMELSGMHGDRRMVASWFISSNLRFSLRVSVHVWCRILYLYTWAPSHWIRIRILIQSNHTYGWLPCIPLYPSYFGIESFSCVMLEKVANPHQLADTYCMTIASPRCLLQYF